MQKIALFGSVLTSLSLIFLSPAFAASPSPAPSSMPAPQFTLQAGVGHFPPQSPLSFMDGIVNSLELAFKFGQSAKVTKRIDIADKKIVHMKLSEENSNNVAQVTTAANGYKNQISAIDASVRQGAPQDLKNTLKDRTRSEDEAFVYLFSISNDKTNPILKDAWSTLQNLEADLRK